MTKQEILDYFKDINEAYNDCTRFDSLSRMLDELLESIPQIVRCNDCIKCQAVNRRNLPPGMYCPVICADVDPLFYCALGTRRGGDGK